MHSTQFMRAIIAAQYKNKTWQRRVDNMPDEQVCAIYSRFESTGKLHTKEKKQRTFVCCLCNRTFTARYAKHVCPSCGGLIAESDKTHQLKLF